MMLTTVIGAMTLAALGPNHAISYRAKDQVRAPEIIEIRSGMINDREVRRGQVRFSDQTRGAVVGVSNPDGSIRWESSERERLGGEDAPALIYIQMFDGIFAIDPFEPLPAANDSTAQMLFRGTTLETDRTQHGRQQIDRTKELFRKLEQARHDWLRDNGYFGVRVITNPRAEAQDDEQARSDRAPEPAAVFERPADIPRGKSREQVNADEKTDMSAVVAMLTHDGEPIQISLPHNMPGDVVARVEKMNKVNESESETEPTEVAIDQ